MENNTKLGLNRIFILGAIYVGSLFILLLSTTILLDEAGERFPNAKVIQCLSSDLSPITCSAWLIPGTLIISIAILFATSSLSLLIVRKFYTEFFE